jgi:glycosyltransferase involved in cell wall biosynthesis
MNAPLDARADAQAAARRPRLKIVALGNAAGPHDRTRTSVFAGQGHDVSLISVADGDVPGVELIRVRSGETARLPWRRIALLLGTIRIALSQKADVWHAHYAADYGTWAAALARRHPLVVTVMGGDVLFDEQGRHNAISRALTRYALRRADLVLVKSNALGDVVASFGVPRERIMRVIWGIDVSRFKADAAVAAQLRAEWVANGRLVLLAPRMLRPFYNHHLLIEALPAIVSAGHDVLAVFALKGADPAYRNRIEEDARRLGVADRLRFTPPRSPEEMASLYAAADLVVSLAPSDGMPQTPLEAGAVERATLMTDLPCYRELFTDGENVATTTLDSAAIAHQAIRLLADPGLRAHIAGGANRVMRDHAELSSEAQRVEARFFELAGAGRRILSPRQDT